MQQTLHSRFRYAELDGLRGIGILMVIAVHYDLVGIPLALIGLPQLKPLLGLAWTAMDMFFVLSGFLLGGILLDNKGASNYFKVFYIRRICRIFPLYYLVLIPLLIAAPFILLSFPDDLREPLPAWTYLTYTQNFAMAQQGNFGFAWLGLTWSLAVEEQFYLILPFLIFFVSKKRLPYLLAGLILAGILYRQFILAFHSHGDMAFYVLLPSRLEPLLLGVLAAWAIRNERCLTFLRTRRKLLYGVLAVLTASCVLLVLVGGYTTDYGDPRRPDMTTYFPATYGFALLGLLFTCLILIAVTERRGLVTFVTRNRIFVEIGAISYAAYLLHEPVRGLLFWLVFEKWYPQGIPQSLVYIAILLGSLVLTLALASISWHFFEKRIVNWGRSFKYKSPIEENVIDEKVVERQP